MMLIVGLGNPGQEYKNTRHNAGFLVVEILFRYEGITEWGGGKNYQFSIINSQLILAKPWTFMNNSGSAVKKILRKYKVSAKNLLIIHDDLDLPLGQFKIQFGRGPRQHQGVLSVETELGTKDFWRLRVGIEARAAASQRGLRVVGQEYVLANFEPTERKILNEAIDQRIVPAVKNWLLKTATF